MSRLPASQVMVMCESCKNLVHPHAEFEIDENGDATFEGLFCSVCGDMLDMEK